MRSVDLRGAAKRIRFARAGLLLVFAALAARAAHLTVLDGRGAARQKQQIRATLRLPAERGLIVDRNGAELAISVNAPSVYAIPSTMKDLDASARALAAALHIDASRVSKLLKDHLRFAFVARWVSQERARKVKELALPGVGIVHEPRRVYPYKELAAQVLGFANIDGAGVRGIEQQEDGWLRGEGRTYAVERDARGRLLAEAGLDPALAAGGDLRLTIDAAFQADAESALDAAVAATDARGGIVITLDPRTGDILALAERPGFDPNEFRRTDYAKTRSRAFLDAFEPGSTLKIFLIAGALERGVLGSDDLIDCEQGEFRVPGKTVRDARAHGLLDPAAVLRVSSNIGATKIAHRLGPEAHSEVLRSFGFGRATQSGFPSESAGLLRRWSDWRPPDHASIAFGQGISVTPIQLAAATATLANDGIWTRPRLIAARRPPGQRWQLAESSPSRRVVRRETARAVLGMMEGVVEPGGTGRRAALRGLRAAGKTGTAQILDPATGTYTKDRYLAWFVGAVPADDPKLVILTELDEPRRGHTGGAAAAPLFAQVAAAQLGRVGVFTMPYPSGFRTAEAVAHPPGRATRAPAVSASGTAGGDRPATSAAAPSRPRTDSERRRRDTGVRRLLPDFHGLTVSEAMREAAANAIEVQIVGEGRAVMQEPVPGTVIAGGDRVRIHFRRDGSEG
jgi:cell division protein FtsI (penicillin-binding protein 3)